MQLYAPSLVKGMRKLFKSSLLWHNETRQEISFLPAWKATCIGGKEDEII